jgi:nitrate/TMAO reductase-like tetraheme cytochrome c subunit
MQVKHLIIFAVAGMVILLGFNMFNSSRHENNRAAMVSNDTPAPSNDNSVTATDEDAIVNKPLGEQPKAIMDKATTQIDQAQQADAERLAQMDAAQ